MTSTYQIRVAVPDDAELIATHRARMYSDMGAVNDEECERFREASQPYFRTLLESGQYLGWLVEDLNDGVIAGAGVTLRELAPHPGCFGIGRWASIGNVYTVPTHRTRGIARTLMETILGCCDQHDMDQVTLSASEQGRSLYHSLGFVSTDEMRLARRLQQP